MATTSCGVGGPDDEGAAELVEGCVVIHAGRATQKEEGGILRKRGVLQKESEMREGGVARQNERNRGAIVSVDRKDNVMREKGGMGGETLVTMQNGAMCEWRAVVL